MTTVILLLALFGVKHFICDFLLQYPYMLAQKGSYGAIGGIAHAITHAVGTLIVLVLVLPWGLSAHISALILSIFDGIAHYHIDWAKQQLNKGLTVADRMFWVWFGADQGLHYLTYIAIIGVLMLA
jgi:hypothetical protein